jgi:hypothetical protein
VVEQHACRSRSQVVHPLLRVHFIMPGPTLDAETSFGRVLSQVAVLRAFADQAEALARCGLSTGLDEHLVEEMAHLGCVLIESAASLTALPGASADDSGVHLRLPT